MSYTKICLSKELTKNRSLEELSKLPYSEREIIINNNLKTLYSKYSIHGLSEIVFNQIGKLDFHLITKELLRIAGFEWICEKLLNSEVFQRFTKGSLFNNWYFIEEDQKFFCIDPFSSSMCLAVYNSVNDKNKAKINDMNLIIAYDRCMTVYNKCKGR